MAKSVTVIPLGLSAMLLCLLSGCARSPSISVLVAFFPDWLFCIAGGILLCIVLHAGLKQARLLQEIQSPLVLFAYAGVSAIFAMAGWLLFFQN